MAKKKEIPKEPQRVNVDFWEYLKSTGLLERTSMIINPTHDFELLKEFRNSKYLELKTEFLEKRTLSKLQTSNFEFTQQYIIWLNSELSFIDKWLVINKKNDSNIIEINKYKDYVLSEIAKASAPPLTDSEKKEIFNKIVPFGLYYENENDISRINKKIHALKTEVFKTIEDFETAIKSLLHSNNLGLINRIKSLNNADFIEALNVQYNLYRHYNPVNIHVWLEFTKELIMEGKGLHFTKVNDIVKESLFIEWYNKKVIELTEHSEKLKEAIITGYKKIFAEDFNNWKLKLRNPLATELQFYISQKEICVKTIEKSKEMNNKLFNGEPSILLYKETNELTKLKIINDRITELSEPQHTFKEPESIEIKEPKNLYPNIFVNGFAYELFLELKKLIVNKYPLAEYGFIYYGLKDAKVNAIYDSITEPKFIEFVKKTFDADISAKKFNYRKQTKHELVFTTTLDKFKPLILSVPKKVQ